MEDDTTITIDGSSLSEKLEELMVEILTALQERVDSDD
jgi:hypothetical protein